MLHSHVTLYWICMRSLRQPYFYSHLFCLILCFSSIFLVSMFKKNTKCLIWCKRRVCHHFMQFGNLDCKCKSTFEDPFQLKMKCFCTNVLTPLLFITLCFFACEHLTLIRSNQFRDCAHSCIWKGSYLKYFLFSDFVHSLCRHAFLFWMNVWDVFHLAWAKGTARVRGYIFLYGNIKIRKPWQLLNTVETNLLSRNHISTIPLKLSMHMLNRNWYGPDYKGRVCRLI